MPLAVLNKNDLRGSPREVIGSLCPGLMPDDRGTLSKAESGHLPFRQVSWLAALISSARPFPSNYSTVGFGPKSRLQWRYRGGLSPPSLFSLGGHLNGQCFYLIVPVIDMSQDGACQEALQIDDVTSTSGPLVRK